MFRLATTSDIEAITQLFTDAKLRMAKDGLEQWNEEDGIPNRQTVIDGIQTQTMYVYTVDTKIGGVIVINDDFYQNYPVTPDPNTARALHRVAVNGDYLGMGIGQKLYSEAESKIKEMGYNTVIVDTYSKNVKMQKLIEKCGYQQLGNFTLYEHLPHWILYQKQI